MKKEENKINDRQLNGRYVFYRRAWRTITMLRWKNGAFLFTISLANIIYKRMVDLDGMTYRKEWIRKHIEIN